MTEHNKDVVIEIADFTAVMNAGSMSAQQVMSPGSSFHDI